MRPDVSPVLGFLGPVVRAVVWYGNRAISLTARVMDPNTRAGRIFVQLFGPFSVPVQTSRTIAYDVVAEILTHGGFEIGWHEVLEYAKHHAIDYYKAFSSSDREGNVSVVFIPGANPQGDILKWDP